MAKNEFEGVKPRPPQPLEKKPTDISKPKENASVGKILGEKPIEKGTFNSGEYIRTLWMYLLADAETKLNPAQYSKANKFWTIFTSGFLVVLALSIAALIFG